MKRNQTPNNYIPGNSIFANGLPERRRQPIEGETSSIAQLLSNQSTILREKIAFICIKFYTIFKRLIAISSEESVISIIIVMPLNNEWFLSGFSRRLL